MNWISCGQSVTVCESRKEDVKVLTLALHQLKFLECKQQKLAMADISRKWITGKIWGSIEWKAWEGEKPWASKLQNFLDSVFGFSRCYESTLNICSLGCCKQVSEEEQRAHNCQTLGHPPTSQLSVSMYRTWQWNPLVAGKWHPRQTVGCSCNKREWVVGSKDRMTIKK